jgi:hypothetical protein
MVRASDGGTDGVDLGSGRSLLQRSVHLVSLTQKRWSDIPELVEGLPWPH